MRIGSSGNGFDRHCYYYILLLIQYMIRQRPKVASYCRCHRFRYCFGFTRSLLEVPGTALIRRAERCMVLHHRAVVSKHAPAATTQDNGSATLIRARLLLIARRTHRLPPASGFEGSRPELNSRTLPRELPKYVYSTRGTVGTSTHGGCAYLTGPHHGRHPWDNS